MLGSKPDEDIPLTSLTNDGHDESENFLVVQLLADRQHKVELFVEVFLEVDDDDIVELRDFEESPIGNAQHEAVQRPRFEERTKNVLHVDLLSSYMAGYPYKRRLIDLAVWKVIHKR